MALPSDDRAHRRSVAPFSVGACRLVTGGGLGGALSPSHLHRHTLAGGQRMRLDAVISVSHTLAGGQRVSLHPLPTRGGQLRLQGARGSLPGGG